MPSASCACRYRFAVELLKPLPISISWLAFDAVHDVGLGRVLMAQSLELRGKGGAEIDSEAFVFNAWLLRRFEHVDAALILRADVLNRDRTSRRDDAFRGWRGRIRFGGRRGHILCGCQRRSREEHAKCES